MCNSSLATIISYLEFLNSKYEIIVKMVAAELALSSYVLKVPSTLVGMPSTLVGDTLDAAGDGHGADIVACGHDGHGRQRCR